MFQKTKKLKRMKGNKWYDANKCNIWILNGTDRCIKHVVSLGDLSIQISEFMYRFLRVYVDVYVCIYRWNMYVLAHIYPTLTISIFHFLKFITFKKL